MINNFIATIDKLEDNIKFILKNMDPEIQKNTQEIRLRSNRPLMIKSFFKNYYVYSDSEIGFNKNNKLYIISERQIQQSFENICEYSVYAYQEEINNGFITLSNGSRVGICGTAVLKDKKIINIKNISSLNIRISKNILNVASELIKLTMKTGLCSILICGSPGSGKTTLLKDIVRQISFGVLGDLYNISVIDERGEIASDIIFNINNINIDIFDRYLKPEGMMIALRTMAPDLIVCDEIGTEQEIKSIEDILNSGVKIIATAHASEEKEIYIKPQIKRLIEIKAFEKIVILDSNKNPCKIKKIIDI